MLPDEVNREKTEARYDDGLLKLVLPQNEKARKLAAAGTLLSGKDENLISIPPYPCTGVFTGRTVCTLTTIRFFIDGYSYTYYRRAIPLPVVIQSYFMMYSFTDYNPLKPEDMPELQLKQLRTESDTWKRLLGFMMEENIRLKNSLSEILKDGFDNTLLDEAENFQARFIKEDELITLLRRMIAEFDKLLTRDVFEDGVLDKEVGTKLKRLRYDIKDTEKMFDRLKTEFDQFADSVN